MGVILGIIIILFLLMSVRDESYMNDLYSLIVEEDQQELGSIGLFSHSVANYNPPMYEPQLDQILQGNPDQEKQISLKGEEIQLCRGYTFAGQEAEESSLMLSEMEDFQNPFVPGKIYPEAIPESKESKKLKNEDKKSAPGSILRQDYQYLLEDDPQGETIQIKNQTKNIPKNFGKAIITFISKYRRDLQPVLEEHGVGYQQFTRQLFKMKKQINTIANLRNLWIDFRYCKCMRIVSNRFLRRHSFHYIFNSRISNYKTHIKYRRRLQDAVLNPKEFKHIKEY